jgi:hypothetical protein
MTIAPLLRKASRAVPTAALMVGNGATAQRLTSHAVPGAFCPPYKLRRE